MIVLDTFEHYLAVYDTVLYYRILTNIIFYYLILSTTTTYHLMLSNLIWSYAILSDLIRYYLKLSNTIWYYPILSYNIRYYLILSCTIWQYLIPSNIIWSYPKLWLLWSNLEFSPLYKVLNWFAHISRHNKKFFLGLLAVIDTRIASRGAFSSACFILTCVRAMASVHRIDEQLRKMQNGFLHFYMLHQRMRAAKLTFPLHFPHLNT